MTVFSARVRGVGRFAPLLVVLVVWVVAPGGTGAGSSARETPHHVDEPQLPFEALPDTRTQRQWGVHQGAGFRIEVPEDWNGELVLYAHGFRGFGPELRVDNPPIREHFVRRGFAWAASSYRRNGYAVEEGIEDTEALRALFVDRFGPARRTYLMGASMGGHITVAGIERYRHTYDGAMPVCGALGDVEQFDYLLDHAAVAAALAGVETSHPPPAGYLSETIPAIQTALGYGPGRELNDAGRQLAAATEFLTGGERPLFDEAFGFWGGSGTAIDDHPFLLAVYGGALAQGHEGASRELADSAGNAGTTYRLDADSAESEAEARLNAEVLRVEAGSPPPFPVVAGDPPVNVLSLHTVGDLFVPFAMEQIYAREVSGRGLAPRLVVRAIRDVGHCGFDPAELEAGFDDLVAWTAERQRPAGDDVLHPAVVADPHFGCRFTLADRPGLPACPRGSGGAPRDIRRG